jgi:SAGA-associated factor 73
LVAPLPSPVAAQSDLLIRAILDDEKRSTDTPSTNSIPASPSLVVNPLDNMGREMFANGRPLDSAPELYHCKHCKKSVLRTAAKAHVASCLKLKKEKAQWRKALTEARKRGSRKNKGENK